MTPPIELEFIVEGYLHAVRIDTFLAKHLRNYTPFRLQRMIRAGLARIDDWPVELSARVHRGEVVRVRLVEPPDKLLAPEPLPLSVLFEDAWLIVLDKPAGVITHPVGPYHSGTLANAVQAYLDEQTPCRGLLRPGFVHRLDRETTGLLVVCKEHFSHRGLSVQFQQNKVSKSYRAILEGELPESNGVLNEPIGRFPQQGSVMAAVGAKARQARAARTEFRVLQRMQGFTLVEAVPRTGRLHQIRVHFAAAGYPVLGDEYYGQGGLLKQPCPNSSHPETAAHIPRITTETAARIWRSGEPPTLFRHALHADRLGFVHPVTGERLQFTAPLPADMQSVVDRLCSAVETSNPAD